MDEYEVLTWNVQSKEEGLRVIADFLSLGRDYVAHEFEAQLVSGDFKVLLLFKKLPTE